MEETIRTRAGRVALRIEGQGVPLVLLHGAGHDHHDFDPVIPTLSRHFQTIAVDWPGHGASEMTPEPARVDVPLLADVLEDVVTALDLPPAVFIGNSVGGAVSIRLAATRPERVRGLVLVDTGGLVERTRVARLFCWAMGHEWVQRRFGRLFARNYLKVRNAETKQALARVQSFAERPGAIALLAALWRSFGDGTGDMVEHAARVECPTLIVWGRHDPVVRAKVEGMRAQRLFPEAPYIEMDTGHVPFLEAPAEFLEAIAPFMSQLPRSSAVMHQRATKVAV